MPVGFSVLLVVLKWATRLGVAAETSQESEGERFIAEAAFCQVLALTSIKSEPN